MCSQSPMQQHQWTSMRWRHRSGPPKTSSSIPKLTPPIGRKLGRITRLNYLFGSTAQCAFSAQYSSSFSSSAAWPSLWLARAIHRSFKRLAKASRGAHISQTPLNHKVIGSPTPRCGPEANNTLHPGPPACIWVHNHGKTTTTKRGLICSAPDVAVAFPRTASVPTAKTLGTTIWGPHPGLQDLGEHD